MSSSPLPRIAVVGTGGTIAATPAASGGYLAGALSIAQILNTLPDVAQWAQLQAEQLANVGSQTVDYAFWSLLSQRVQVLANRGDVDGIVITHGTDTLEESAYFLNLTLRTRLPVVLTGAMRPAHALGADGSANLHAAIVTAAHPDACEHGVLVVMNEKIHGARDVQKMAASGLEAFASPNTGALGTVKGRHVRFRGQTSATHTYQSNFAPLAQADPAAVMVLYSHGDLDVRVTKAMLALQPDGIVLAGVGGGYTTDATLDVLGGAAAQGIAVVRCTRTGSGCVERNVEIDDDKYGFIAAQDLSPQKARLLLMLGLQQTRDTAALQNLFFNY